MLLAGCSSATTVEVAEPSPTPTQSVDFSGLPAEFAGTGSFVAGVDIQPGLYEEESASGQCEWFLGVDGTLVGSAVSSTVVVADGETVELEGCSVMVKID